MESFILDVTKKDIREAERLRRSKEGKPYSICTMCPTALAAKRALAEYLVNGRLLSVNLNSIIVWDGDLQHSHKIYELDEKARAFVSDFTAGNAIEPFSTVIKAGKMYQND